MKHLTALLVCLLAAPMVTLADGYADGRRIINELDPDWNSNSGTVYTSISTLGDTQAQHTADIVGLTSTQTTHTATIGGLVTTQTQHTADISGLTSTQSSHTASIGNLGTTQSQHTAEITALKTPGIRRYSSTGAFEAYTTNDVDAAVHGASAGDIVYVGPGRYTASGTLNVTNIIIAGAGRSASVIVAAGSGIVTPDSTTNTFQSLTFDGTTVRPFLLGESPPAGGYATAIFRDCLIGANGGASIGCYSTAVADADSVILEGSVAMLAAGTCTYRPSGGEYNSVGWTSVTIAEQDTNAVYRSAYRYFQPTNPTLSAIANGTPVTIGASNVWTNTFGGLLTQLGLRTQSGSNTVASGVYAHAEGFNTQATNDYAHAEGASTAAKGVASHAEGWLTTASGSSSHAEGTNTIASGNASHTEGQGALANTTAAHAEGVNSIASGYASHAEGAATVASGYAAHADGKQTTASGYASHASGSHASITSDYSYVWGDCWVYFETGTNFTPTHGSNTYTVYAHRGIFLEGGTTHVENAISGKEAVNYQTMQGYAQPSNPAVTVLGRNDGNALTNVTFPQMFAWCWENQPTNAARNGARLNGHPTTLTAWNGTAAEGELWGRLMSGPSNSITPSRTNILYLHLSTNYMGLQAVDDGTTDPYGWLRWEFTNAAGTGVEFTVYADVVK